jgi:hypothetical protein
MTMMPNQRTATSPAMTILLQCQIKDAGLLTRSRYVLEC